MYDEKVIAEAVKKAVEQMQQAQAGDDNDIKIMKATLITKLAAFFSLVAIINSVSAGQ